MNEKIKKAADQIAQVIGRYFPGEADTAFDKSLGTYNETMQNLRMLSEAASHGAKIEEKR